MLFCTRCGHELGVGRFCTNCGHPVDPEVAPGTAPEPAPTTSTRAPDSPGPEEGTADPGWRTDTAERPVPLPRTEATPPPATTPHPAGQPPSAGPRYPLFADEVGSGAPTAPATPTGVVGPAASDPAPEHTTFLDTFAPVPPVESRHRRRRGWAPWAALAAVVLVLGILVTWQLAGGGDGGGPSAGSTASDGDGSGATGGKQTDVAATATAKAPVTAPPNEDVGGQQVSYAASNLLDGDPTTTWRMPGDGTGTELVIKLDGPTTLASVGLINGYAKQVENSRGAKFDWYHGNRRITSVEWDFGKGRTVRQELDDTLDVQSMKVDPVKTGKVRVRVLSVTAPGKGRAARNYTAISEISLTGSPA